MGSLVDDIATWLDTNSTRLTLGSNLFKYSGVDSTGAICWLSDDQGGPPTRMYGGRWPVAEEPTLMVVTRSTRPTQGDWVNPTSARRLSQEVWGLLESVSDVEMPSTGGQRIWRAEAIGSPGEAGRDDSGRLHFIQNFVVTRTPSTGDWE